MGRSASSPRAASRTSAGFRLIACGGFVASSLRERGVAQSRLGRAQGQISAARAYGLQTVSTMWAQALEGTPAEPVFKNELQLAGSHAVEAGAEALELVRRTAGTSAIQEDGPLARPVRDMAVLTQHAFISDSRFQSVGQLMLGLETDWAGLTL